MVSLLESDAEEFPVLLSSCVSGVDCTELPTEFFRNPDNIQFLARELGRVAVKDFTIGIQDRISPKKNIGNLMLQQIDREIDTSSPVILIDNLFEGQAKLNSKIIIRAVKEFILSASKGAISDYDIDEDAIKEGMRNAIRDLEVFIEKVDRGEILPSTRLETQNWDTMIQRSRRIIERLPKSL